MSVFGGREMIRADGKNDTTTTVSGSGRHLSEAGRCTKAHALLSPARMHPMPSSFFFLFASSFISVGDDASGVYVPGRVPAMARARCEHAGRGRHPLVHEHVGDAIDVRHE